MKSRRRPVKQAGKKIPLVDKIVLGLNIVATLALLLSYLAPVTDPRDWSIIAVLGFGYPLLLLVNVVFIIYWLFRARLLSLISVLGIALGFNFILLNYGFHKASGSEKVAGETIRMMAYNVHQFKGIEAHEDDSTEHEIIQLIRNYDPDIINIEEYHAAADGKGATADSIKKNYKYYYFEPFTIRKNDSIGNAIFSKYPMIKYDTIPSPAILFNRAIFADIKYKDKVIRVYCVHLAAVKIKERQKMGYLQGKADLNNSSFVSNKLSSAFVSRSLQVSRIKSHIAACPYPYIIGGDFNDTPVSFSVNQLSEGGKDAFREKGSGYVTTYYTSFPLQIDHIIASSQFNILSYQAIDRKISDHKPVISDLALK